MKFEYTRRTRVMEVVATPTFNVHRDPLLSVFEGLISTIGVSD